MSGNLSLHAGYDVGYLTDAVGSGAADYYLSAAGQKGEPPGFWLGRGARHLGLFGEVDPDVMRALYHRDEGPDGPLPLAQARPKFSTGRGQLADRINEAVEAEIAARGAFVTPEEVEDIRARERAKARNTVPFFDFTFSAAKSVSVAHAGYVAAAIAAREAGDYARAGQLDAQAGAIMNAMRETAAHVVATIEQRAAFTRTGHAGREFRDARGVTAAAFPQRTSRDGDPQLHVHIAVLNRVQRDDGADGTYRTLDSRSLHRERLGIAAIASRVLDQKLSALGFRLVARADGNGHEIGGVTEETMAAFSARRASITPELAALISEYEREHGHAPSRRTIWSLRQWATLRTRKTKHEVSRTPAEDLAVWTETSRRAESQALAEVHADIADYGQAHGPAVQLAPAERNRAARIAVAEVQRQNATWTVAQLLWELHRALPALPASADPVTTLEALAADIIAGKIEGVDVVRLAPAPDPVDVSVLGVRDSDGESVYRAPGRPRFATADQLDTEQWLLDAAIADVGQAVTPDRAEAALAASNLDRMQRTVTEGLLTASRLISVFVAPAGTGKTHVVAAAARAHTEITGARVYGLTLSTNAARVVADEMRDAGAEVRAMNIAQALGKIKDSDQSRGHLDVRHGDVIIVDEASQVGTPDLLRIVTIAREAGAQVWLVGDTAQLASPENGGVMRLIAYDHGHWKLAEVRRFAEKWEGRASLRLRQGDIGAIPAYRARGRIRSGPQNIAYAKAVQLWATDYVRGKDSLLMAGSNQEAAELARLAREYLVQLKRVPAATQITLSDGNEAGTGDLIRARLNTKIDAGGQSLSNRDTIRLDGWQGTGSGRHAIVTRQTGPGQWSRPFLVPAAYLEESAELAYAGNTHVAQGQTVDTGHLLVSETLGRESFYVGMTRGREANIAHVVTGPAARPGQAEPDQQAPAEAVIAAAMARDTAMPTATETVRQGQAEATDTGWLLNVWSALTRESSFRATTQAVKARLSPEQWARYQAEPQRHAVTAQLRAAELAGHDVNAILDQATRREWTGANSIAAALHGRIAKLGLPEPSGPIPWASRVPASIEPERAVAARETGAAIDARIIELGAAAADQTPPWATRYLGVAPREAGALRDDWIERVGQVAAYREAARIDDPDNAVCRAPAGNPELRSMYLASVSALEMVTEEAEVKAASQGDLEARVRSYARQAEWAPPSVATDFEAAAQAEQNTRAQIESARAGSDLEMASSAEALVSDLVAHREALDEIQAARDEWNTATEADQQRARLASAELSRRGIEPEPVEADGQAPAAEPETEAPGLENTEIDRQVGQARKALERLHAEPEAENEADQWAREMASELTEPSPAWQAGHSVTEPEHQAEEADIEM